MSKFSCHGIGKDLTSRHCLCYIHKEPFHAYFHQNKRKTDGKSRICPFVSSGRATAQPELRLLLKDTPATTERKRGFKRRPQRGLTPPRLQQWSQVAHMLVRGAAARQRAQQGLHRGNKPPFARKRIETTRHSGGKKGVEIVVSLRRVAADLRRELPRNYALTTEPRNRLALQRRPL